MNEDMAWERVKDLQREIENRRLMGETSRAETLYLAQLLVEGARSFVRVLRARARTAGA